MVHKAELFVCVFNDERSHFLKHRLYPLYEVGQKPTAFEPLTVNTSCHSDKIVASDFFGVK